MLFSDYKDTGFLYHIAPITDLEKILENGIKYDDKESYANKYIQLHTFIDNERPKHIPNWVIRKRAIFASLNYRDNTRFHSHTVVLAVKVQPEKCWIANENLANKIYEPLILQNTKCFKEAKKYIDTKGRALAEEYWNTSLSFLENLHKRYDAIYGYDAEALIQHTITPNNIKPLLIVTDHRVYSIEQWRKCFCIF
ncbi:hypothetical protein F8154_09900 [Alkaliphilus pronyensis]|uniref:DUF4433 domain-containing protein n=2 Tax=Alkaliphilus pronyensis TaxID=1482732 RepID=A0A6I0F788_9FIRM|nr:hypothetical protein F8154_09900 [Alkaliphilus pronyensis]